MTMGAATPVRLQSCALSAVAVRPCARNAGNPKIIASAAPKTRCNVVPAGGSGTAPRVTPDERTSVSTNSGAAHWIITAAVNTPAAGSAQSAASVRHAIATVATERSEKIASAVLSWLLLITRNAAANRNAPIDPEDTPSIFPGSAGGPYFSPDTISAAASANPATT